MSWTRRRFLRDSAGLGVAVASGAALLGACADTVTGSPRAGSSAPPRPTRPSRTSSTRARPGGSGPMSIGIAEAQPWAYRDESGEFTGESVEVARTVLRTLGIDKVTVVVQPFEALIPALSARRFDMVAAGLGITRDRCRQVTFSVPDHAALTAFAVPAGNPKGIRTFAEVVAGKATVAVLRGSPQQGYAEAAGAELVELPTLDVMVQALAAGEVDCGAFIDILLRSQVTATPGVPVEVTPGFTPEGQDVLAGAFAFRKGEDDLVEGFNSALTKLHSSGEWLTIAEPFGFTKDNLPQADLTTEQLCAGR